MSESDGLWEQEKGDLIREVRALTAEADRLKAALQKIMDEPEYVGPAHDRATRVVSYRALHELLAPADRNTT